MQVLRPGSRSLPLPPQQAPQFPFDPAIQFFQHSSNFRSLTTGNRSKSVKATINVLTPVLRGWISYFRLT
ncbi:group II intron maturase-specific domain-containing protein, partial [Bacillus sp. HC-Mk]